MAKLSEKDLAAKRLRRKGLRVQAKPDDPIYSRGWQIGSALVFRQSTTDPEAGNLNQPEGNLESHGPDEEQAQADEGG